ncbi:MAG TPA: dTDP-4-dehydrorhamnose reductase [Acidobacteriaceae bacterium]|nr:dTDP-4-dehydrorhamnose reductase [Acidobacteriaceae bacterium]
MTRTPSGKLRILITGRDGQVGSELVRSMGSLGVLKATTRTELDLASDESIAAAVRTFKPDLIVNAAAYTAVDKAESEPELAGRINCQAVATLAAEAKSVGAAVIHYSTDYVFDGAKTSPYREEDVTNPLSVYGKTKLAGEQALAAAGVPYLVLRTSWVYGATGKNFLLTILKLAQQKPELRIVADQSGAPTWSRDIAEATAVLAAEWLPAHENSGVFHLTARGSTTWHGFASQAIRLLSAVHPDRAEKLARLIAISTAEYPTAAVRPKNSQLDCSRLAAAFHCRLPEWSDSLAKVMEEYEVSDDAAANRRLPVAQEN